MGRDEFGSLKNAVIDKVAHFGQATLDTSARSQALMTCIAVLRDQIQCRDFSKKHTVRLSHSVAYKVLING